MTRFKHIEFYIGLVGASIVFLVLENLTHWEFLYHLAAVPFEILIAVFVVEHFLEQRETKEKRRQLMYIKSYLFRSELRPLFLADFAALKFPAITMAEIRTASLETLRVMRKDAETVELKEKQPGMFEEMMTDYILSMEIQEGQ